MVKLAVRRLARARQGTAAIEFALVAPLFLLLLFGSVAYGLYFGASHSLQQITADAARTAVAGLSQTERQALATGFVSRNAGAYPFIDAKSVQVEATDSPTDSSQFTVSVRYDASALPIWNLLRDLPLPGRIITRTASVRIGGL